MENNRESQAGHPISEPGRGNLTERLVLASSSPRRAAILRDVGWEFETVRVDVDETRRPDETAVAYVERLALEKAEAGARLSQGMVLGADTIVVVDSEILGKPTGHTDAARMLRLLSGRWHEVLTGVAVIRTDRTPDSVVASETTLVRFAPLSEREIDWYVASGEPMDKAGAYAIQGRAALFIEEVKGNYLNVVGLPVSLVYRLVRQL
jgi:septum formation protein